MNPGNLFLLVLFGLCISPNALALKSDRDQPVDIKADQVFVDNKKGMSRYSGNVKVKQGTLIINANEVTVLLKKGKLDRIVITGKPASFEQQPDNRKHIVKSRAEHMEYFTRKELLVLQTNAEVIQGGNSFKGDHIEYDTYNSVVKANKDPGGKSRVHTIIQPRETKEENDKPQVPAP